MARYRSKSKDVKIYRVGGSVRDELLGRPVVDRDWVVVGATPEILVASGYKPVGRDFPVFIHRDTGEEYALARTERKHGRGYRGFEFFASPDVTLAEDLARRDLTINAMARDEKGALIDPFGGQADLRAGLLRHVSPAFVEDPLRVLRVARFAARFGFAVAPETARLMRVLVASGELAELAAERVWQELARGLMEPHPARLLAVLRECGALAELLPEVAALDGAGRRAKRGKARPSALLARALEYAAQREFALPVRYAVLAHRLGGAGSDGTRASRTWCAGDAGRAVRREDLRAPEGAGGVPRRRASCGAVASGRGRGARRSRLRRARSHQCRRRAASSGTPRDAAADVRVRRDVGASPGERIRGRAGTFARHWTS